jgi:CRISPR-associated Csx2 family protein
MAKILISPLGTGAIDKNNTSSREYKKAKYQIDNQSYESSFVASVLYQHLSLDGIIYIGTVKSMWEEVYRFFSETKNLEMDEDYYWYLSEKILSLDHQSNLNSLDLSKLAELLGDFSQCILIKYGLNQDELWENLDSIINATSSLKKGDEVYLDITHSFRSLSIFQFLTLTFINDLLSEKEIKIVGVYYGMLDVVQELGFAPIIDLKSLLDMTSWIKGTSNLTSFGNGYLIAELLQEKGENDIAKKIVDFSEAININYVSTIRQKALDLKSSLKKDLSSPFKYLAPTINNLINKLSFQSAKDSDAQINLAEWYFDNKRYATGYITLAESIITYLCELESRDSRIEKNRNEMKDLLHQNKGTDLFKIYSKVNPIRNAIAHALLDKKIPSEKLAISSTKEYIKTTKAIFKTGKLNK